MPTRIAIALLSAAAIAYEILLIRLLSITQWHHFAAMIISLALLGYGVSGTVLTLLESWLSKHQPGGWQKTFVLGSSLFGILSTVCTVLAQRAPFNSLAVVWDPTQLLGLVAVYLLLALPFFCVGTAIGALLVSDPDAIGGLYGADLVGAGVGAALLIVGLFVFPVSTSLRAVGAAGCLAAGVYAAGQRGAATLGRWGLLPAAALLAVIVWPQRNLEPRMSQYKTLSKALLLPGAEVVAERSGPLGLLTLVDSPQVPFRHAPGLSLTFAGQLPEQLGLFVDGDSMTVVDQTSLDDPAVEYLDFLPAALGYFLREQPTVLVVGAAGGTEVQMALRHGAQSVHVVEANRQLIDLLIEASRDRYGSMLEASSVVVHPLDGRSFLRGSGLRFDLIMLPQAETLISATSGGQALGTNHLMTVEAVVDLLGALESDGLLVVSRWLRLPPRDSLKLFATLAEALRQTGVDRPSDHLAQIRAWGTVTTLVKRSPWRQDEVLAIEEFCRARSFDRTTLPGLDEVQVNLYNQLEEAYLYRANLAILQDPERFFKEYKFDVRPATDDRPFFSKTFRWRTLPELLSLGSRAGVPLIEWGYLILVATVLQALAASIILILLPLRLVRRGAMASSNMRVLLFFASLGMGFMLIELAFFERFTLYLGHPTLSMAVVLSAFLIAAGSGSVLSRRLSTRGARAGLSAARAAIAIVGLGIVYWMVLPPVLQATVGFPMAIKLGLTFAVLAPLGFLLGMPFPLGLVEAARSRSIWIPWAWGINGSASVLGSAAAPLVAMHQGISALILTGLGFYVVAGLTAAFTPAGKRASHPRGE